MRPLFSFVHKSYIVLLSLVLLAACRPAKEDTAAQLLLQRLDSLQKQGCMFGHQDDPMYGVHWQYEPGRSDVLESCGDYPAVMGFDLGGIEIEASRNLDSVPFDRIRTEIQEHHRRGGIVTLSWHPRNPITSDETVGAPWPAGTSWDVTSGVVASLLPGGAEHQRMLVWLSRVRDFLASLTDDQGKPIPLIFRPWHENNGGWFWWGATHCTPEEYHALWNMTQDYINADLASSIVWAYSPNLDGSLTEEKFLVRYPGDDRVDMIGLDAYQWGTEEDYVNQAGADLNYLCAFGAAHNKLVALTECGRRSMPDPTWWNKVFLPLIKSYPLSYALVWRNGDAQEHFGPVPGTSNAAWFKIVYNNPRILFLNDIAPSPFVRQQGGAFKLNGKEYTYVGTNLWYGAILASQGQGGDRERLIAELDTLQALGVTNLRILVGSDGDRGVLTKVEPTLQIAPGVYNDTILDGLDWLLCQMGKRDMKAVLYLNNSWEWSGGYGFYLEHAGYGPTPRPEEAGYETYMRHVAQFATSDSAQHLFYDYVRFIVSRTNRYSKIPYTEDPTIMAWQIGNEPRAFGEEQKEPFACWLRKTSALIRSIDKNHLISIGSEGIWGCEMDSALYDRISADPNIDYMTVHIWPYNWGWVRMPSLQTDVQDAIRNTDTYLRAHNAIAARIHKPIVIEEFGFPRDNMSYTPGSPTIARDSYYQHIFDLVKHEPTIAGCNFWAWGGSAKANHNQWRVGDDYTGDPAQEPQGLNSVFVSDTTTLAVIHDYTNTNMPNNRFVWSGELEFAQQWTIWKQLPAELFEHAEIGQILQIRYNQLSAGAQLKLSKSNWDIMPDTEIRNINGLYEEYMITPPMLSELQSGGLIISGTSFLLTGVQLINPSNLSSLAFTLPVRDNWVYDENPVFTIYFENPSDERKEADIDIYIKTDQMQPVTTIHQHAHIAPRSSQDVEVKTKYDLIPGFYNVTCIINDVMARNFVFAVHPTDIVSPPDKQADFEDFWTAAKSQLKSIDMRPVLTEIPTKSTAARKVYLVEFYSIPDGLSGEPVLIRGYYCEPQDGKKHPVIIHYAGYDSGYRPGGHDVKPYCPSGDAEPQYAEFYLATRGQYINNRAADEREPDGKGDFNNTYGDWFAFHFGDKDSYYYRGAFMDCVQAVRFMATRPTSDMNNLFAEGHSQGGAFTYAAAALSDYPFRAIAPAIAFMGDYPDYFKIAHWPANVAKENQQSMTDEQLYNFLSYFDTKNLATMISSATLACLGLQDDVCPPHTNIAPYNNLRTKDKRLVINPELKHQAAHTWYDEMMQFFQSHIVHDR